MKKLLKMILTAITLTSCSPEGIIKQTKDVIFTIPVKSSHLYISDHYDGKLTRSHTLTDVDTATVEFKSMEYGIHQICLITDQTTTTHEIMVSDTTNERYILSPLTVIIEIEDKWDGEIIY